MQLKTCPFCGGKPYIEESQRGYIGGESTKVCFIRCSVCNARSERVDVRSYGHTTRSKEAVEDVAARWNARADKTEIVEVKTQAEKHYDRFKKDFIVSVD